MNTLKERVCWARAEKSKRDGHEFTQGDLASKVGVTQGNIAHLESGRTKSSRNLTAIAEALGVDPRWLAEGKGKPFPDKVPGREDSEIVATEQASPVDHAPPWIDPEAYRLLNLYYSLDQRRRGDVMRFAEGLQRRVQSSAAGSKV